MMVAPMKYTIRPALPDDVRHIVHHREQMFRAMGTIPSSAGGFVMAMLNYDDRALTWVSAPDTFRLRAEVVELVDALRSGRSGRKPVGVRVPPSAL